MSGNSFKWWWWRTKIEWLDIFNVKVVSDSAETGPSNILRANLELCLDAYANNNGGGALGISYGKGNRRENKDDGYFSSNAIVTASFSSILHGHHLLKM